MLHMDQRADLVQGATQNAPGRNGQRLRGLFLLDGLSTSLIYGEDVRRELQALADFEQPPQTRETLAQNPGILREVEVIFSGWGAPVMDEAFLEAAPNLQAIFYGAGSIRACTTPAFWQRDIVITSAYAANAIPVAEYTLSTILLSLKHFWRMAREARRGEGWGDHTRPVGGAYRAKVGLVSFGMIARKTSELLGAFDVQRLVSCPFLGEAEAEKLQVRRCSLPEIFQAADVVSLHTPDLPETRGLITGSLFASMKKDATFINTARGPVVRQEEMIEVLQQRPDLTAVLDVTDPEPPERGSPLLTLPNVVLTPHIAGSMGVEIQRLGQYMLEEFKRYLAGEALKWRITRELAQKLA